MNLNDKVKGEIRIKDNGLVINRPLSPFFILKYRLVTVTIFQYHYSLIRIVKDSAGEKFFTLEMPPASIFWTSSMSLQFAAHLGSIDCLWHRLQGLSRRFPISKSKVAHVEGLFSILASR
jgi:hypothetical protein